MVQGRKALCPHRPAQAMTQQTGKQVVVAIPLPPVIQWHDEQVGLLEILQDGLAAAWLAIAAHHGIAQRAAQTLQNRSVKQEALHRFRLPGQHFVDQIIHHVAVIPG